MTSSGVVALCEPGEDPRRAFETYLARERQYATRTVYDYLWWLTRFEAWAREHGVPLLAATPKDVRRFTISGDWAPRTQAAALSALKSFYRWCEMEEFCVRSPASSIPNPRLYRRIGARYRPQEVRALSAEARDTTDRLIVGLGVYEGLRTGEALGLRLEDLDFDAGVIRVRRTGDEPTTKGRREREIPIHPGLRESLRTAVRLEDKHLIVVRSPRGYQDRLRRICRRAKVIYHGPHALRRTFATRLAALDVREGVIHELLGHTPRVTDLYIDVTLREKRKAIRLLRF